MNDYKRYFEDLFSFLEKGADGREDFTNLFKNVYESITNKKFNLDLFRQNIIKIATSFMGLSTSEKKKKASRDNGRLGGRPRTKNLKK